MAQGWAAAAGEPCLLGTASGARLAGRDSALIPRSAGVYVLGLLSPALGAKCRPADRSSAAEPIAGGQPACSGCRTWVRGEAHPSDHAPAWIEIELRKKLVRQKRAPRTRKARVAP